jgi:hypothetical protein
MVIPVPLARRTRPGVIRVTVEPLVAVSAAVTGLRTVAVGVPRAPVPRFRIIGRAPLGLRVTTVVVARPTIPAIAVIRLVTRLAAGLPVA